MALKFGFKIKSKIVGEFPVLLTLQKPYEQK